MLPKSLVFALVPSSTRLKLMSGDGEAVKPKLVCEVEYDYYSQGRFRHGSKFLRWRPEKKPRDCSLDQVEG